MRVFPIVSKSTYGVEAYIDGFDEKKIKSLPAIRKIAEDRDLCIFIRKISDKNIPDNNFFILALVYKFHSAVRGASQSRLNALASNQEVSVKLFNTVMSAISNLENKAKIKKIF